MRLGVWEFDFETIRERTGNQASHRADQPADSNSWALTESLGCKVEGSGCRASVGLRDTETMANAMVISMGLLSFDDFGAW